MSALIWHHNLAPWKKSCDQLRQHIKKQRHHLAYIKVCLVKAMVFFSSHAWLWELDHRGSWVLRNWCFLTHESPLDCKEIKPVNPKGNQSWLFIGNTDAGAEAPILWPPEAKNWLIGKDHDTWKDWRQEEKGMTEDEMVGWHHLVNRPEFEQAPGVGDGQGRQACCSP